MVEKRVILITGASSGIGAATARLFAEKGYCTVLAARRSDRLQLLAEQINAKGGDALPVQTDLSDLKQVRHLAEAVKVRYGRIDILFNNAGFGRLRWLEELDEEMDVQSQLQLNLVSLSWMTQAVLPLMISQRSGHIINMASMAGLVAPPTYSIYSATKFGVRGFSEAMRREVRIYGIDVSVIYPGAVETEFIEHALIQRKTGLHTPDWLVLSAEEVAKSIWKLANRPKRMVVIPRIMRLAYWLNTLFPGLVDWAVQGLFVQPERR